MVAVVILLSTFRVQGCGWGERGPLRRLLEAAAHPRGEGEGTVASTM